MPLEEQATIASPADDGPTGPITIATMSQSQSTTTGSALSNIHHPTARIPAFQRWAAQASDSQFNALAGAVGGFTSGVLTCPLDVIKTKLQVQGGLPRRPPRLVHMDPSHLDPIRVGQAQKYNGLIGTSKVIWQEEGIRGMYRGLGPIVLGYLPTWAVWFTVYNKSKRELSPHYDNNFVVNFWSSIIAGASSTTVTNPIWVIKTRLMSQTGRQLGKQLAEVPSASHTPNTPTSRPPPHIPISRSPAHIQNNYYRSTIDAARQMYTTEGIRAFYSGLTPALLGLTHVAVQFPVYEYLRMEFTGQGMGEAPAGSNLSAQRQWAGILSASIISKILASSATYPHEVIRTRLQTQRRPITKGLAMTMGGVGGIPGLKVGGASQVVAPENVVKAPDTLKYRGIVRTFQTILREEGWNAFYAGMGTNMMRAVPAATVTMLTYEFMMRNLNQARANGRSKLGLDVADGPSGFS